MRNPISGTRMIQLSEQEWWLTAASMGPMQVWGVEDAFQGLAQAEASQARQETKNSLAAAGWVVPVGEGLQFHPWLVELAGVCQTAKAVLTVQSARGRLRQQIYLNGKQALLQKPLSPGVLELTMIPNQASLMVLLADDLLLESGKIGRPPEFALRAEALLESAQLFRIAKKETASEHLAHSGLPDDVKERLLAALAEPYSNTSVTLIPYASEGDEVVAQGFALLEGEDDLWMLTLNDELVEAQPVSPGMIRRAFVDLIGEWFEKE